MKALYLYGGWPGHAPYEVAAQWCLPILDELGFEVTETNDTFLLESPLEQYDLIVNGWTQALTTEDMSVKQEENLLRAVHAGTGMAGWHGMAASFRASLPYGDLIGSSFIEHPGGEGSRVPYDVHIVDRDHEITRGIDDFNVATEQYVLQIDPNINVIADCVFSGEHRDWIKGERMPVAYTKNWGKGRIFYCTLGHYIEDLQLPQTTQLMKQAFQWASRTSL